GRPRGGRPGPASPPRPLSQTGNGRQAAPLRMAEAEPAWHPSSWLSEFGPEVAKLKGLAIGTVAGLVRDALTEVVPEGIRPHVADVMDDLAVRFGGERIPSQVLGKQPEKRPAPPEPRIAVSSR